MDRLYSRNGVRFYYDQTSIAPVSDTNQRFTRTPDDEPVSAMNVTSGVKVALITNTHGDVVGGYWPWRRYKWQVH